MDRDVTKIERIVYNSFMLLGDIGGVFEIIIFFSTFLVSGIVNLSMQSSLISDSYHVQKYNLHHDEYYKSKYGAN